MAKRTLDIVGLAVSCLPASSAPLLISIAVAVKLDSRGPVLFPPRLAARPETAPLQNDQVSASMYRDADERKAQFKSEKRSERTG